MYNRLQNQFRPAWCLASALLLAQVAHVACRGNAADSGGRVEPEYDSTTGTLRLLKYDANNNGRVDTWSYMDGRRIVRIEIDTNEDGTVDRWEHYDESQKLASVGASRAGNGKEDVWSYAGPDGSIARLEISTNHDGKVTRIESYDHGVLVRAEEDTDKDGRMDKWESYDQGRLTSVAYDTSHRGAPDRRLLYAADGGARLEVAGPDGQFSAVDPSTAGARPR